MASTCSSPQWGHATKQLPAVAGVVLPADAAFALDRSGCRCGRAWRGRRRGRSRRVPPTSASGSPSSPALTGNLLISSRQMTGRRAGCEVEGRVSADEVDVPAGELAVGERVLVRAGPRRSGRCARSAGITSSVGLKPLLDEGGRRVLRRLDEQDRHRVLVHEVEDHVEQQLRLQHLRRRHHGHDAGVRLRDGHHGTVGDGLRAVFHLPGAALVFCATRRKRSAHSTRFELRRGLQSPSPRVISSASGHRLRLDVDVRAHQLLHGVVDLVAHEFDVLAVRRADSFSGDGEQALADRPNTR